MPRYQRNRRRPAPNSLGGSTTTTVTPYNAQPSLSTIELNLAVVAEIPAPGSNDPVAEIATIPENITLDASRWIVFTAGANETPVSVTMESTGLIIITASGPITSGDRFAYDGKDPALDAATGFKVPPIAYEFA